MAQDLKSLVTTGSARELQEKLENWQKDYEGNSFGENLNRCCEILELNTAIQKQLFSILNETSRKDTNNEGDDSVKYPLLPSLASEGDSSLAISEGPLVEEAPLRDAPPINQNCHLQQLEDKLSATRAQIKQMEQDLRASRLEECKTLRELEEMANCEQQIQALRDEIALLDVQKSLLKTRAARSRSPRKCCESKTRSLSMRTCAPTCAGRVSSSHRAGLVARFTYIYAHERVEAETLLRGFVCNMETVRRIIYIAAVESFRAAKTAFRKIKASVKETLALDHVGPETLEAATLDYIVRHKDLYDICHSVQAVICSMNRNPKMPCPPPVDFCVIRNLIRELCCLAFSMQTLIPPLDIAVGVDGETFNRSMYYRSCDSDFTASFVAYHVWPALMENCTVIVKGEVVTKKHSLCCRRSRIRSRSCSCGRRLLPGQVGRSRSLSTMRVKTPRCCC